MLTVLCRRFGRLSFSDESTGYGRAVPAFGFCRCLLSIALFFAGAGTIAFADEYSWTGAGGDKLWTTEDNWSGDGIPSSGDTIKPNNSPSLFIDLANGERTVSKLDFSSAFSTASRKYPSVELSNGTLILVNGLDDSTASINDIDSGVMTENCTCPFNLSNATLKVQTLFKSGCSRSKGYMFSVGDGGSLILDHVNLYDKFSWVRILPGGTADFTFNTTVKKDGNSTSRSTWSNEGGTFSFPGGFTLNRNGGSAGWSKRASFRLQHHSGVMNFGGNVSLGDASGTEGNAMGLYFQWFGGTVHALSNVTFNVDKRYQWGSSEAQESFIQSNSVVTAEVDSGKTMDMSVLTLRDGVSLTKTGDGALLLADVPYSLDLQSGTTTFSANTRTGVGALKIGTGTSFTIAHANMTLATLEDNAGTITIAQPGLSIGALGAGAALSGTFAFNMAAFTEGDIIVTTSDATLRAKIKADAETAFASAGVSILESGDTLTIGASSYVFDSTTVTDLNDSAGWQSGLPAAGCDVIVSGAGVNAIVTADLTNVWKSITVQNGASLAVSASGLTLPSLVLRGTAALRIEADFDLPDCSAALDGSDYPTLVVAPGVTLTVPAGYKFSNVHLVLCDGATLTESGDGPLVFGYASANETTFFAMHATNATITALDSTGSTSSHNGSRIDFASPAAGGTVVVEDDIVLKGCTVTYNQYDGFAFGLNNPTSQAVRIVADGTELDFGATSYVAGGANLVLTNGSVLFRRRRKTDRHDSDNENTYSLYVQNRGRVTAVAGGEIRASITDKSNVDKGVIGINPDEAGYVGVEILDGGIGCWYKAYSSNGKGAIRYKDGVQRVFCGNWWSWGNRSHIYNGLAAVEIESGATMTLCGVFDLFGDNDKNLGPFPLEAPFAGGGDLLVTNTWTSYKMCPVLSRGDNTCTGTLAVAEGTASSHVYIANGANWAGTICYDGKMSLVDAGTQGTPPHASPVAVSFGALDLQVDFPIMVWAPEGEPMTNDTLNVGAYVNNGGKLVPTMMTDGVDFARSDMIVVGTIGKSSPSPAVKTGWAVKRFAIDGDDVHELLGVKKGVGFQMIIK